MDLMKHKLNAPYNEKEENAIKTLGLERSLFGLDRIYFINGV